MRTKNRRLVGGLFVAAGRRGVRRRPGRGREAREDGRLRGRLAPVPTAADGAADSLRAAIIAANGNGEDDVITLSAGVYKLTIPYNGGPENAAALGDLDLREANHTV